MKIVFNGLQSGLANNGGSKTIVTAVNILNNLGCICDIAAVVDNFTWIEHRPTLKYLPSDYDVVVNIAAVDYQVTKVCDISKKVAWWRGHEIWANSEDYLISCYTDKQVYNLTNSKGLQHKLKLYGAESDVLYQGIDLDRWYDTGLVRNDKSLVIGCLYGTKVTKGWSSFLKLIEKLGSNYKFIGFGLTECPGVDLLDEYYVNPSYEELLKIYNSIDIYFSPTILEGLHNPPMEAALCGAALVCNNNISNGMVLDYANMETAFIYDFMDIDSAVNIIKNVTKKELAEKTDNLVDYIRNVICDRETNMLKFIKWLETW